MKIYSYFENMGHKFRLENINDTRFYLLEEVEQNESMSKRDKKVCATLNYIEHIIILVSTITRCILISAFASLIGIPIGITRYSIGLKIYAIAAAVYKNYKSIAKKKKNKHGKIELLPKSKLNIIEVLISKALAYSIISHDEFVLINNLLKEYDEMKEEIINLKT